MDCYETRWRVPSALLPFLMCLGFLLFIDVFLMESITPQKLYIPEPHHDNSKLELNGFLIKTPGCRIPQMDPFDKSVKKFIENPSVPKCNNGKPSLFESNLTSVYLIPESLKSYNIVDVNELYCCYYAIERKPPKNHKADTRIEVNSTCNFLNISNEITEEFIKVECTYNDSIIYKDFFNFIPIKNNMKMEKIKPQEQVNILIIGLDAVSRINLHRQMPQTVNTLNEIGAVELLGYNKVGDNTFPNIVPVLVGKFESEIKNGCWPLKNDYFDNCSFVWNDYKKMNYATAFGEDSAWMGIFNYNRRGFFQQPTDYCYGYFNRIAEKEIGNSHNMNVFECFGAREVYKDFLNYIKKFATKMQQEQLPYFGFFWGASLSHDYLNKPKLGDEFYSKFFYDLKNNSMLNNTVLIFMSDHGIRWGGIRQTYQGKMEERLPFVFIVLPEWFKIKYNSAYNNLQKNMRRLTTPFDLHETLKDFRDLTHLSNDNLQKISQNVSSRGYSLFTLIPIKRTCEDAQITDHWCTCQQSVEMDKNDSNVVAAVNFVIEYLNDLLSPYPQCSNLSLSEILNARFMTHGKHILDGDINSKDYMVTIQTLPGEAVFEVTVRYENNNFQVIGTISRLNLYGTQSACITDYHMKLYCYCKKMFS